MEKKKAREAEEHIREVKKQKDEELEQERKKLEEQREVNVLGISRCNIPALVVVT